MIGQAKGTRWKSAVLSIWEPGEIQVAAEAITIGRAARLKWGSLEVVPAGAGEVEIRHEDEVVRRPSAKEALVLRLQMGEPGWSKTFP